MNIFTFTGNLGSDAELRYTPSGDAICSFSVAVRSGYGEKEATTWVRATIFKKRAESLAPYLLKGQQVAVSGELTLREYETKEGKGHSLDVRVNEIDLIGKKVEAETKPTSRMAQSAQELEDDLPF